MDEYVEVTVKPGQADQGLKTVAGLAWLVVVLCHTIPGLTLLLMIPPLALCLYPLVVTPIYGLRMGGADLLMLLGQHDRRVALRDIDHMEVTFEAERSVAVIVLQDGSELALPSYLASNPLSVIREASNRGVPVRLS